MNIDRGPKTRIQPIRNDGISKPSAPRSSGSVTHRRRTKILFLALAALLITILILSCATLPAPTSTETATA